MASFISVDTGIIAAGINNWITGWPMNESEI